MNTSEILVHDIPMLGPSGNGMPESATMRGWLWTPSRAVLPIDAELSPLRVYHCGSLLGTRRGQEEASSSPSFGRQRS